MLLFYFLITFFIYLLSPSIAHAWGPGAHLEYSLHALSQVALLTPVVKHLLKKHPHDFLYGSLAADIVLGKKFAGELYHCHHWNVALPLIEEAQDDRQRAFMYGYLTHLAVDTVSHNYFVPFHIIKSYQAYTLRHTYWEMRFDLKMPPKVWGVLKTLADGDYHRNDILLSRTLKKAIFSFQTNKKIFDSLLLLQRTHRWRNAATLMAKRSSYALTDEDVHEFKGLCHETAVDFLQHLGESKVLSADPTGKLKLLYAREMVVKLRRYTNRRILSPLATKKFISQIRHSLREGIYKPVELPDIYDAV